MPAKRQRFAVRRKAVGFSQEQLAERMSIDRSTVARWESGETEPQPWICPRHARVVQVSLDQLDHLLAGSELSGATSRSPSGKVKFLSRPKKSFSPEFNPPSCSNQGSNDSRAGPTVALGRPG